MAQRKEYILWGTPAGSTDAIDERVLYTQAKTVQEMEEIKARAAVDGWHSFRVQILDLDAVPNFGQTLGNYIL